MGLRDITDTNSKYYYGVTNVFAYQINRNFFGGIKDFDQVECVLTIWNYGMDNLNNIY
jgi:hypothetical protein